MSLKKKLITNQVIIGLVYAFLMTFGMVLLGLEFRKQYSGEMIENANSLSSDILEQSKERDIRTKTFYETTFLERIKSSLIKDKQILAPYFEENSIYNLREYLSNLYDNDSTIYSIQFLIVEGQKIHYWFWVSRDRDLDLNGRYIYDRDTLSWEGPSGRIKDTNVLELIESKGSIERDILIDGETGKSISIPIYEDRDKAFLRYTFTLNPLIQKINEEKEYNKSQIANINQKFENLKEQLFSDLTNYLITGLVFVFFIAVLAVVLASLAAYFLSQQLVRPLEQLASHMTSHNPDIDDTQYLTKIGSSSIDEVSQLSESFVVLTSTVREKIGEIQTINRDLEETVKKRTSELASTNDALVQSNSDLIKAQEQIKAKAHRAGMSEIAVEIIHNIGNVSNTLNLEVESLDESIEGIDTGRRLKKLLTLGDSEFYNQLERIKGYLNEISKSAEQEKADLVKVSNKIRSLNRSIIGTVEAQRQHAIRTNIAENFDLAKLVKQIFSLQVTKMNSHGIKFDLEVISNSFVKLDEFKFTHIIVNLLTNAQEALLDTDNREVSITLDQINNEALIIIQDSGPGIPQDMLDKVFAFGFTTKKTGTGLGLHSAINSIREMGGSMQVEASNQLGGAKFTISLPAVSPEASHRKSS